MNSVILILDFVIAILFSAQAYDVGRAYIYAHDPRWTAEQFEANRKTVRASYVMIGLATMSGLLIVPLSVLSVPFWEGPWWASIDVAVSIIFAVILILTNRPLRDLKAQRYRLIS